MNSNSSYRYSCESSYTEEPSRCEETVFLCEGNEDPLIVDRSSSLAVECWNLRKTILESNSNILKLRSELKTQKNLVKNLQKMLAIAQNENQVRAKESGSLKEQIYSCEKSLRDLQAQTEILSNSLSRQKKASHSLQTRLVESEKAFKLKLENSEKEYVTFKNELILQEDALKKQLHQQKAEIQQLNVEKESLNSVVQHANLRIEELEELTASLHKEVDELHHACDNSSLFINKELENAYEKLQGQLEGTLREKQHYWHQYQTKDFENQQLLSFILSEGLQLPTLQQYSASASMDFM